MPPARSAIEIDRLAEDQLDAAVDRSARLLWPGRLATSVGAVSSGGAVSRRIGDQLEHQVGRRRGHAEQAELHRRDRLDREHAVGGDRGAGRLDAEHGLREHRVAGRIDRVDRDVHAEVDVQRRALVLGALVGGLVRVAVQPAAGVGEQLDLDVAGLQADGDLAAELDVEAAVAQPLALADRERDRTAERFRIAELRRERCRRARRGLAMPISGFSIEITFGVRTRARRLGPGSPACRVRRICAIGAGAAAVCAASA